jgi:hypothetical protein
LTKASGLLGALITVVLLILAVYFLLSKNDIGANILLFVTIIALGLTVVMYQKEKSK